MSDHPGRAERNQKPETGNQAPKPLSLTVLICTSGRPKHLDRCLSAIESGTDRPEQLVVVNGTDAETPAVIGQHVASFEEVVLIQHPNRNLATLRNLGLPYCSGDIVAMTDDDAIAEAGWIAAIRTAHTASRDAGGIGGSVRGTSSSFLSRVADTVVFPDPRAGRPIHTLPTVNMSYSRPAMEQVGDFDQRLFRGEDVDYNWRMIQAGHRITFEPAMQVRHEHRKTLLGFYQQQYMYGRAYVLVRSKWPEMYSVYPHSLKTPRSWAKLAHATAAIIYQPLDLARSMPSPVDRLRAYPILVIHHLVWKLAMLRQATALRTGAHVEPDGRTAPRVSAWRFGRIDEGQTPVR